jgi:hypothetical protein
MLLSQSLLRHGSFTLDDYSIPKGPPTRQAGWVSPANIYQLELLGDHIYYYFPPGSSVLSVPYVALMNALGISASNADGSYNPQGEVKIEASLASLLMASFTCVVYCMGRMLLSSGHSFLVALGAAFGTQIYSTATRALWSDTWAVFLIGLVVWMLVAQERERFALRPVILATLVCWAYFVRPTNSLTIVTVTVYILLYRRILFASYAATGAFWLAGFVVYSYYHYGRPLPKYFLSSQLDFGSFGVALAGNLVSPARGLLVFVPIVLFVGYLLIRNASWLSSRRLVFLSLGVIAGHYVTICGFSPWWGGHCYGPRYTTGLVPWFALLAALAVEASNKRRHDYPAGQTMFRHRVEIVMGIVLLALSILVNAVGAIDPRGVFWNVRPVDVDSHSERLWDWRHPQFWIVAP